jgi:hypothetical protein
LIFALLAFALLWNPVAADCHGAPLVDLDHYEVTVERGSMQFTPTCPLDPDGLPQRCAVWTPVTVATQLMTLPVAEPAVGEVVAWDERWLFAVDMAWNASGEDCP